MLKPEKIFLSGFTVGHRSKSSKSKLYSFMWGLVHMNTNMARDQSERKGQAALSVVLAAQCEGPIGAACLFLSSSEYSAYTHTHTVLLKWVQFVYCHPLALSYAPIWIWRGVFVLPMQRFFTLANENYHSILCHKCFPL